MLAWATSLTRSSLTIWSKPRLCSQPGTESRWLGSTQWNAEARVENSATTVWQTVVEVVDEIDALLIVLGARGRNAAKRALLGRVAEAVSHHAHRPPLIAPEPHGPRTL